MNFTNHALAGRQAAAQSYLRLAFYIFLAVGLLAAGYAGYIVAYAKTYQAIQMRKFAHDIPIAEPRVPVLGETIGQIQIPSVGLKAIIIQGASAKILRRGIGHLPETPLLGEPGNIALAAHRDTFFRPLKTIRIGDVVILRSNSRAFRFKVDSAIVVSPADIRVLAPSGRNELTLLTCFPFDYIGPAPSRFVVHASEITEPTVAEPASVDDPRIVRITDDWISSYNSGKCNESSGTGHK